MWKIGDKCQAQIPNTQIITRCEIIDILPKSNFCELRQVDTNKQWLAILGELRCIYYFTEYYGEDCTLLSGNIPRCETCPNKEEYQSTDI